MRPSDLPKRETCTGTSPVGKGASRETVYRCRRPTAWMIWVKLDCLKSNGELETEYSLDTTAKVKTWRQQSEIVGLRNPPSRNKVNETDQTMNGHPNSSYHVTHDCRTGSPTGCEPYGDGNSIVVGGVTSTQGGWESQPQGKGS